MRVVALALVLAVAVYSAATVEAQAMTYGADISVAVSTSTLTCLRGSSPSIQYVVFRAFRSTGTTDPDAPGNLRNAISAGYSADNLGVYLFPCPRCATTGAQQVTSMMTALINAGVGKSFTTIWLDIEGGGGDGNKNLYWLSTTSANLNFFNSMLSAAQGYMSQGYKVGIYTGASQWSGIVGSSFTATAWPLWYAAYNSFHNFGDFKSFGGWTLPAIHQYAGDATVCSTDMDLNVITAGQTLLQAAVAFSTGNGGAAQPVPDPNPQCTAAGGKCIDTTTSACTGGSLQHGKCSGSASVLCCVGGSGSGPVDPNPACTAAGGKCIDTTTSKCTGGSLVHGKCSGNNNILCCVGGASSSFLEAVADADAEAAGAKPRGRASNKLRRARIAKPMKVIVTTPSATTAQSRLSSLATRLLSFFNHSGRPDGERLGETIRRAGAKAGTYVPHGPLKLRSGAPGPKTAPVAANLKGSDDAQWVEADVMKPSDRSTNSHDRFPKAHNTN